MFNPVAVILRKYFTTRKDVSYALRLQAVLSAVTPAAEKASVVIYGITQE